MKLNNFLIVVILCLIPILWNCESKDKAVKIELKKENLIGKYFGVNDEGEDDFHVLEFNLYKLDNFHITGNFFHVFALFDPIPQEFLIGKGRESLTPQIFELVKPHVAYISEGSVSNGTICFKTDSIQFDEETKIAWEFTGKIKDNYLNGELTEYFTPIFDKEKAIKVKGLGKVQTFKKMFTLKKIE